MKRIFFKLLGTILFCVITILSYAQTEWDITGNNNVTTTNNILGTQAGTNIPIRFQTNGVNRMYIDSNFIFGSATMNDTTGTSDDSRMFFNKAKGAFRAGEVTGTYWDADSSGLRSFAAGFNTKAVGNNSAAFGNYTQASGDHTVAMGDRTQAIGTNSIAFGSQSTALGSTTFN